MRPLALSSGAVNRRNLTPSPPLTSEDIHGTRRGGGGARRETSDRVTLKEQGSEITAWALNVSRGGIRVVLEDPVEPGSEWDIQVGDDERVRRGRVVWVQDESDGQIAGVQFLDAEGGGEAPPAGPPSGP